MSKKILIDAACQEEIRVAVVDERGLLQLDHEISTKLPQKGNIYIGKIHKIEASLQALFIEYMPNKFGFLPFSAVWPDYYRVSEEKKQHFIKEPADYFSLYKNFNIYEALKFGDKLLVQVTKEERGNKGVSLSTYVALCGRYLVLKPYECIDENVSQVKISKQIEEEVERTRLEEIINSFELGKRVGVIVRTAACNVDKKDLLYDYTNLATKWERIHIKFLNQQKPGLLYSEGDIIEKTIRDVYDKDISSVIIQGEEKYEAAKKYAESLLRRSKINIRLYKGKNPIFTYYRIEDQILALYKDTIELPSGGYIVINPTEALVAIDVNSGKMNKETSIEETAYKTNLEAAYEIAHQVELRSLSGLIVIDFIDMTNYKNCQAIEAAVEQAFGRYKAKVQMEGISQFGLLQISRQRTKSSIGEINAVRCNHCNGSGRLLSKEYIGTRILRQLPFYFNCESIVVSAESEVVFYLLNNRRAYLKALEDKLETVITIKIDPLLSNDKFLIETTARQAPIVVEAENQVTVSAQNDEKSWLTRWFKRFLSA